jgi:hopanoid-associated phosphorylase
VTSVLSPNLAQRQDFPIPGAGEGGRPVIVIVGLRLEARIAFGQNAIVVCHDKVRGLPDVLQAAVAAGCSGIISFGLAGGLAPEYRAGDWVIASSVIDEEGKFIPTSALWSSRLLELVPYASYAPILGVDQPLVHAAHKCNLHSLSLAAATDNESHLTARFAREHGLEFAALRVIIDPAHRRVPDSVLAGLCSDGSTDIGAILRRLLVRPFQTLDLVRLTADYIVARSRLIEARRLLGAHFGRVA